jgi:integral membrane protein
MIDLKWSFKKGIILFLASLIPFGTFWAERKYLRG